MTEAEAYGMWFHSEYGRYPDPMGDTDFLAWKAACKYQREKDAETVKEFSDSGFMFAEAILNQGDE